MKAGKRHEIATSHRSAHTTQPREARAANSRTLATFGTWWFGFKAACLATRKKTGPYPTITVLEPWPRQLDRKLDSYLTGYSTATRQDSSTATRQLLDRPRHNLDRTPLTACAWASRCQARQLDSSTARLRQLDRARQASTRSTSKTGI